MNFFFFLSSANFFFCPHSRISTIHSAIWKTRPFVRLASESELFIQMFESGKYEKSLCKLFYELSSSFSRSLFTHKSSFYWHPSSLAAMPAHMTQHWTLSLFYFYFGSNTKLFFIHTLRSSSIFSLGSLLCYIHSDGAGERIFTFFIPHTREIRCGTNNLAHSLDRTIILLGHTIRLRFSSRIVSEFTFRGRQSENLCAWVLEKERKLWTRRVERILLSTMSSRWLISVWWEATIERWKMKKCSQRKLFSFALSLSPRYKHARKMPWKTYNMFSPTQTDDFLPLIGLAQMKLFSLSHSLWFNISHDAIFIISS